MGPELVVFLMLAVAVWLSLAACTPGGQPEQKGTASTPKKEEAPPPESKQEEAARPNRLIHEKSPYLLQHARNPVDWYPWGAEAFERAGKEDKPIFLSIGYSTCHWCHVMEHESFEDREVAAFLNEHFVSIKVDREEREDVDNIYMSVCMAMTGSGGWPLTIIMDSKRIPIFAGTYFPKEARYGRTGIMDILGKVVELWKVPESRQRLLSSVAPLVDDIRAHDALPAPVKVGQEALEKSFMHFSRNFDPLRAGFGRGTKFPTPHNYSFLLRHYERTGRRESLDMVTRSLKAMRLGGLYDQVGFGFHRYSTDAEWLVPHFEKMLYDQAMLMIAYVEAYQVTKDPFFERVVREIATYVLRDMTSPEGGFYSAEDADSEGEEGKFYLWTDSEWPQILGEEEGRHFSKMFGFEKGGNWVDHAAGHKPGTNIPHLEGDLDEATRARWEEARRKLFDVREKRIHPHKDDKILTSWNGLMIAALAKAAQALREPVYAVAAERSAKFIFEKLYPGGRLLRRYRDGEAAILGYVDDYAFLVWGLIDLYEATFNLDHLRRAVELNDRMLGLFLDKERGGLFFSGSDGEKLIMQKKELYDGAVPSGNSVAMLNQLRLWKLTGRADLEQQAIGLLKAFSGKLVEAPFGYSQAMIAVDWLVGDAQEIVIAGRRGADDTRSLLMTLRNRFMPRKVVIFRPAGEDLGAVEEMAGFTKGQDMRDGRATVYVCENFACQAPANSIEDLLKRLKK